MTNKLAYLPLAFGLALGPAAPASAAPCETVYLMTGDRVDICWDNGSCLVYGRVSGASPGVPNAVSCTPYPAGSPPYCNGMVGDVTVDTCLLDSPACPVGWVFIDPPGVLHCV